MMVKQGECEGIWDLIATVGPKTNVKSCWWSLVDWKVIPTSMFCTSDKCWVDMCVADVVPCVSMCLTSSSEPQLTSLCRRILPSMGLIYFM